MNEIWTPTGDGDFVTEISELRASVKWQAGKVQLPTGEWILWEGFQPERDREGDVKCWSYKQKDTNYIVFND